MYEQGEIVVVHFPFSDLSNIRQRPVLILSKSKDNMQSEDVVTCGITSNLKNTPYSVLIDNKDLEKGVIPKESRVKVNKIFTLDKAIIRKKIAKLNKNCFDKVKEEYFKMI
ncbi:MAG: type II toxin-antitoxin system PemK/MazF family toxin [Nanoarchaeota archaeon]